MSNEFEFQDRVGGWLYYAFGNEADNKLERLHRFLEEGLELVQSLGCSRGEAHQLVDYVFDRPVGDPAQELGGTMTTLAALSVIHGFDMNKAGEVELERIWEKVEQIRAKRLKKPELSPLPQ
jgi:Ni2+-binding GTPase involved in maturation of urease and hydrogenase